MYITESRYFNSVFKKKKIGIYPVRRLPTIFRIDLTGLQPLLPGKYNLFLDDFSNIYIVAEVWSVIYVYIRPSNSLLYLPSLNPSAFCCKKVRTTVLAPYTIVPQKFNVCTHMLKIPIQKYFETKDIEVIGLHSSDQ